MPKIQAKLPGYNNNYRETQQKRELETKVKFALRLVNAGRRTF